MTQTTTIKSTIERLLGEGVTDKHELYTKVVEQTNLPRSTVRRVAAELLKDLKRKCEILSPKPCEEGNHEPR